MKFLKLFILSLLIITCPIIAQEIPITDLLYPVNDYEFKLSPSGKYLASFKKFTSWYALLITDVKSAKVKYNIPLGGSRISNLNWISETRISYEQIGMLYAINIDGTENQQLMSFLKNENKSYFTTSSFLNNLQSSKMVNVLEDDFEHILVETRGIDDFPIIYKLNTFTGEKEEIENGEEYEINQWLVDRNGQVRLGIQNDDGEIKFFTKDDEDEWESKNDLKLDMDGSSFINQKLNFLDFDYDENIIYLASTIDNPRWRILAYDLLKKTYVDTILEDAKYDIGNPVHEDTKLHFMDLEQKLVGITYEREKPYTKWFSEKFQILQDTLQNKYVQYYPQIFDWNEDASIVLVNLFSDVDPGHIVIYDSQINRCVFFTTYAKELLNYQVSNSELIKYKTRDDYEIEGYLNLPSGKRNNVPFIIMPHGGPWARDYWRYDPVVQFFANQGYGVLRMNFRGSTGYGIDHLLSGVKKISSLMIDDITDGTKWIIENNFADSSNIFLYGHSYGGYAVLQSIIRYPDLYQAAVSVASPTDIVELMDYFDDQENEFNYEFWKTTVGDPDREDEYLEKISPIYNIEKITKPVFLFHGEKDGIIPVSQTEEFIEEAEDVGKKIEYKIIKDEDHNISENRNVEFILRKSIQFYKKKPT